jgi:hypothetical protein
MQNEGEYREIDDEVDWNLEIGAIIRRTEETLSPMPIFNKTKDCWEIVGESTRVPSLCATEKRCLFGRPSLVDTHAARFGYIVALPDSRHALSPGTRQRSRREGVVVG